MLLLLLLLLLLLCGRFLALSFSTKCVLFLGRPSFHIASFARNLGKPFYRLVRIHHRWEKDISIGQPISANGDQILLVGAFSFRTEVENVEFVEADGQNHIVSIARFQLGISLWCCVKVRYLESILSKWLSAY